MPTPSDFAKEAAQKEANLRALLMQGLSKAKGLGSGLKAVGGNAAAAIGDVARGTKSTFQDAFNGKALAQAKAPIEALGGKATTDMHGFLSQMEKIKALEMARAAARKRLGTGAAIGGGIVGLNAISPLAQSALGE